MNENAASAKAVVKMFWVETSPELYLTSVNMLLTLMWVMAFGQLDLLLLTEVLLNSYLSIVET